MIESIIERAKIKARVSPFNSKHCAIATDKRFKKVVYGVNNTGSSSEQRKYANQIDPYKQQNHAEIEALRKFPDAEILIVIRVGNNGSLLNSEPCPVCFKAISESKIKKVYYSNGNKADTRLQVLVP